MAEDLASEYFLKATIYWNDAFFTITAINLQGIALAF